MEDIRENIDKMIEQNINDVRENVRNLAFAIKKVVRIGNKSEEYYITANNLCKSMYKTVELIKKITDNKHLISEYSRLVGQIEMLIFLTYDSGKKE